MRSSTNKNILKSVSVKVMDPKFLESLPVSFSEHPKKENQSYLKTLLDSKEKETQVLREAEAKGRILLEEAQKKAEDIIKAAQNEREAIRKRITEELEKEIRDRILPEAKAKGYEQGLKEAEKEALEIQLQAKQYLDYAQNALAFELKRVDKELLDLSIKISEKIIGTSIEVNPRLLLNIIRKLVITAGKKENLKICVSEADFVWLQEIPNKIKPAYPMVVDPRLSPGNAYLDSEGGVFSGQIDSQLDKIREALLKGLEDDKLAATGSNN
ncbi:MAG: FliH/SctL family protein [Bacillota bacterium]|jgi:flagellar assembly protein FliH